MGSGEIIEVSGDGEASLGTTRSCGDEGRLTKVGNWLLISWLEEPSV